MVAAVTTASSSPADESKPLLVVIVLGPTGSGKTALSLALAERFMTPYLDRHPGDIVALTCQGDLQIRQGRLDLARQTILTVLALDARNPQAAAMLKAVSG